VVINIYWFCYGAIKDWGVNIGTVDKILLNFQRQAGLFSSILWTKLFAVVFLGLSCLGTKGVKKEKIKWSRIYASLFFGLALFFLNGWLLKLPFSHEACTALYVFTLTGLYPVIACRTVDEPPFEEQPDGRRLQYGERILYAGNPPHGERVFREPAHPFLLPKEVEQGLDKCGQSFPGYHRAGHARLREILRRHQ
jgi:hypothetical protein